MDDLELAYEQPDMPGFFKAVAIHLIGMGMDFLVDIQFIAPIFDLEAALAMLGDPEKKAPPFYPPFIADEEDEEALDVHRLVAAECINDAILLLKALGEEQAIPHLKKAFDRCPGSSLVPERSSYLQEILTECQFQGAETLVAAAERRWATIN
jgi:hypothetical protein